GARVVPGRTVQRVGVHGPGRERPLRMGRRTRRLVQGLVAGLRHVHDGRALPPLLPPRIAVDLSRDPRTGSHQQAAPSDTAAVPGGAVLVAFGRSAVDAIGECAGARRGRGFSALGRSPSSPLRVWLAPLWTRADSGRAFSLRSRSRLSPIRASALTPSAAESVLTPRAAPPPDLRAPRAVRGRSWPPRR